MTMDELTAEEREALEQYYRMCESGQVYDPNATDEDYPDCDISNWR